MCESNFSTLFCENESNNVNVFRALSEMIKNDKVMHICCVFLGEVEVQENILKGMLKTLGGDKSICLQIHYYANDTSNSNVDASLRSFIKGLFLGTEDSRSAHRLFVDRSGILKLSSNPKCLYNIKIKCYLLKRNRVKIKDRFFDLDWTDITKLIPCDGIIIEKDILSLDILIALLKQGLKLFQKKEVNTHERKNIQITICITENGNKFSNVPKRYKRKSPFLWEIMSENFENKANAVFGENNSLFIKDGQGSWISLALLQIAREKAMPDKWHPKWIDEFNCDNAQIGNRSNMPYESSIKQHVRDYIIKKIESFLNGPNDFDMIKVYANTNNDDDSISTFDDYVVWKSYVCDEKLYPQWLVYCCDKAKAISTNDHMKNQIPNPIIGNTIIFLTMSVNDEKAQIGAIKSICSDIMKIKGSKVRVVLLSELEEDSVLVKEEFVKSVIEKKKNVSQSGAAIEDQCDDIDLYECLLKIILELVKKVPEKNCYNLNPIKKIEDEIEEVMNFLKTLDNSNDKKKIYSKLYRD